MDSAPQSADFAPKFRRALAGMLLVAFTIPAACILGPLATWVWLPDIWSDQPRVLMDITIPTQDRFVITEQLTDDFYLSQLHVTLADGSTETYVIDGDGPKIWFHDYHYNAGTQEITFLLNRQTWARYNLKTRVLIENREPPTGSST